MKNKPTLDEWIEEFNRKTVKLLINVFVSLVTTLAVLIAAGVL